MTQKILGIDIGSHSVKIAEIERSFKGFEFVRFYERKIVYNELLKPEESMAVTLQGLIDDNNLKCDSAIAGYPGEKISARQIELPFGSTKKIDQTIEFELEEYIPFDIETLVTDYHILKLSKDLSEVMVFYTLKTDFEKHFGLFRNSPIDPRVITPEWSEYLNLMTVGMHPPETPYAVVDIGHRKTNITICRGREMGLLRSITIAGEAFTGNIARKLGVSPEEAERMKIEMGNLPKGEEEESFDDISRQVSLALRETMEQLTIRLKQVLFSYRNREGEAVGGIFLCGGTSRIPGIDYFLSDHLKLNVTHLDPTTFHFYRVSDTKSHRNVMPQALAIALRSVASSKMPQVNLRRGPYAFTGDIQKIGGTVRHAIAALALILAMGLSYFGAKYYVLSKRLEALQTQITETVRQSLTGVEEGKISSPKKVLGFLSTQLKTKKKKMENLGNIKGTKVIDILKEISVKVPPRGDLKIDIESFSYENAGRKIEMRGLIGSDVAVESLEKEFEASPLFAEVKRGDIKQAVRNEGMYTFKMDMALEQNVGASEKKTKKGKKKTRKK